MNLIFVLPAFLLSVVTVNGAGHVTLYNDADCKNTTESDHYTIDTKGNGACHNVNADANNHGRRGAKGCSHFHCLKIFRDFDCKGYGWKTDSHGKNPACASFQHSDYPNNGTYDILSFKCQKAVVELGPCDNGPVVYGVV